MRKMQKFSAAVVMAGVMAVGMATFGTTVHASSGAPSKASLCAAIDKVETAVQASTNPFVKKYLQAILAGLQRLEVLVGGCAGS